MAGDSASEVTFTQNLRDYAMQKIEEPVMLFSFGLLFIVTIIAVVVGTTSIISAIRRPSLAYEQIAAKQLHFAAVVLTGLGLIFALSMAMFFWAVDKEQLGRGQAIFDSCKTIIPPIITLILGYYFGKTAEPTKAGTVQVKEPEKKKDANGS